MKRGYERLKRFKPRSSAYRKNWVIERQMSGDSMNGFDWIACASRDEIEEMLMHSVCDDVGDMCRFIDAKKESQKHD